MTNEVHELTPVGHIKRPSYALVCSWVKTAWGNVSPTLICKSFKCCGVSVETDGSEDDKIFDYDGLMMDEDKENNDENDRDNELLGGGAEENMEDYDNWNEF